jgi:hypothetical protein
MPKKQIQIETKVIIQNPKIWGRHPRYGVQLYRIELTDTYSRIDFITTPDTITYDAKWWTQISKDTFIRPVETNLVFPLLRADNITLAPDKYFFKDRDEILPYSLFFPPIPKGTEYIDIIELENGDDSFYNFYLVSLIQEQKEAIYKLHKN